VWRAGFRVMGEKATSPVDKHVGRRVRMRRQMLAMSQEKLGNALGLSFQQVQKYERGMNRIGASRLQQIGEVLQVPVSFFFEDTAVSASAPHEPDYFQAQIAEFVSSPEGLRLIAAFERIKSAALRREIVSFVKTIGSESRGGCALPEDGCR
jgi:transcriptional regulator with XRE-family HTH domain